MDFGRAQRGFLLDGEDPPGKVGCKRESYFLEFMYLDVARDFVAVVFHVLLDGAIIVTIIIIIIIIIIIMAVQMPGCPE